MTIQLNTHLHILCTRRDCATHAYAASLPTHPLTQAHPFCTRTRRPCPAVQPEQIRQCLVDYASINVWQLQGADSEAPSIVLAAA